MTTPPGQRWAVVTAASGTVFIAAGAFWLSFTSLTDLASRSGIGDGQAWAWPLIVDGIIVTATVAVVALAGQREAWYPWTLLIGGAAVSVTANALHAVVAADASVPGLLAASVAAVPPVVLLAITHLTVILTRPTSTTPTAENHTAVAIDTSVREPGALPAAAPGDASADTGQPSVRVSGGQRQERAVELRQQGWSNKQIARAMQVHPSTVGRWFARAHRPDRAESTTQQEAA